MGFAKKNTKVENEVNINNNAVVKLTGTLIDVYEGDKFNYAKVRCNRTKKNGKTGDFYYDEFSVKFDKSIGLPNEETKVEINGYISSFFNRDIERTQINITGFTCEVSNW